MASLRSRVASPLCALVAPGLTQPPGPQGNNPGKRRACRPYPPSSLGYSATHPSSPSTADPPESDNRPLAHGRKKAFPNVKARLSEVPPEGFGDVAVTRDGHGNYFCSFVYDDARPQPVRWKRKKHKHRSTSATRRTQGIVAFDLGVKELATGYIDQVRFYHIGGFKGYSYYNHQLDKLRSKRDRCKKKSRRYITLFKKYKQIAEKKRRKQQDCHHKASQLVAHRLAESAVVVGDLSQRQMVMKKKETETAKERRKRQVRNRLIYNDWGLYRPPPLKAPALQTWG